MTASLLAKLYEINYGALFRNLAGITHEESFVRPAPAGNCLNWVLGHIVATHVPSDTTDQGIETLVKRFRKVGRQTHHFASMKIQPTTPGDPGGWYRRIVVYVFDDNGWAEA